MKKYLSLLLLYLAFSSVVCAFEVTFDATVDYVEGGGTAGEYTIVKNGITMHIEQGVTNGKHYRIYKGHSITICSDVGDITSIIFYCVGADDGQYGPANFTVSAGTYATSGYIGSWTGRQRCVTFVAYYGQVRITKIVVNVDGDEGLQPPFINPMGGTYYSPIEVSMACATEGAAIYYTVDGTNPTTSSALYTAPFTLESDATVKAVSVLDGEMSPVVCVAYVFEQIPDVCLGDLDGLANNERVVFNHEATVLYQLGSNLYLRDECGQVYGYGLIYGNTGQTYQTGDVIPPGWGGTKTFYDGHAELSNLTGFQPACRTDNIMPELITIPQICEELWAHYVELRGVHIDQEHQLVIDQQGNSCPYHPQLSYSVSPTQLQDIRAIVTSYRSNLQLLIIEEPSIIPPPPPVCCLADLYEYEKGQVAEFGCPLTVIYQNGANLYVKDSCGEYGLIYGNNAGGPFENGDLIIGQASWTEYQSNRQLTNHGEWTKIGKTDPVEPIVFPVEELSTDLVHWYVKLVGVTLVEDDDGKIYVYDGTERIIMFNKFNVEVTEVGNGGYVYPDVCADLNLDYEVNIADIWELINRILTGRTTPEWVGGDGTYDITGFLTVFRGQLEIYPVKIEHHGGQYVLIGDVNGDGEVNIADVNCIINLILWN